MQNSETFFSFLSPQVENCQWIDHNKNLAINHLMQFSWYASYPHY
jgi:hypothetical protein